eukprot:NODE_1442_length_1529_cov_28.825000_g1303_i0.p1 GENE.NODE_1442_length_1529_cov_28.825000_g1303_i0~~NODE_1442_length_1529_cov_28.825000_g1303_i0.p1  ORF type:complete len:427 (-),score=89.73 NODE_1442_length_1529_cov_28.825000_g1303_i0:180-1460(-)
MANVLVIGSGGREHALCWKLAQSPAVATVFVAPGNTGMQRDAQLVSIDVKDHAAVIAWCSANKVELVVVGPEAPLCEGIADSLATAGIKCFGPKAAAAQLEASKSFTKMVCDEFSIPTAKYRHFEAAAAAKSYAATHSLPVVVKADGLAAGKGVVIATTHEEAAQAIDDVFSGRFGAEAGSSVVIEEFLGGEEISFYALSDGETAVFVGAAQDHKRVGDGDTGANTGGMGAYLPPPLLTPELTEQVMRTIINPTVQGMKKRGTPFEGVLFAGLMVQDGQPYLLEYNVRFGDPETQVLVLGLESDIYPLLIASCTGALARAPPVQFSPLCALGVVMAAKGYPESYAKGTEILKVEEAERTGARVFHAGTALVDGRLVNSGGRVLCLTAQGATVAEAQKAAYAAVDCIEWTEGFCRRDIGHRAIEKAP